jgi:uncharacterized membrane-anchored protein YhcB (DUF1043 family)
MSDINETFKTLIVDLNLYCIDEQGILDHYKAAELIQKYTSELEAENARLKGKVAQLEEAFDVKNRVHEKLNKDYLQLKAELAARDWQSADKLPEEEGFYVISVNNIILEDSEPTEVKDLQDTLTSLEYCKKMGYRNIKHFKLPPVEGK